MTLLFFFIALAYSIIGFGGGSSYIAALVLFGLPYQDIPQISLVCNLIVTAAGTYHFIKNGHFSASLAKTLLCSSIPLAFLGGMVPLSTQMFSFLLGSCLIAVGTRLLFMKEESTDPFLKIPFSNEVAVFIGALLGFISGLVGIGGGIFLSPILLGLGWGRPKQIAATASIFILLNSIAGLMGQIIKHRASMNILHYWPLFVAVFIGGQIGSRIGAKWISQLWIIRLTSVLVLWVGIRLFI